ncbi:2-oxoglutarate decarboxylase domain protein [Mycobacterium kansasii]|uniref:2-oxoglutarate decarboxylase domain protein n=1 Tax=Mycobacterium kansasii TaxID=1768 RepID=A0A1V3XGA5_MYCKA|nr:2-oxoglutarate decarboxylase domain protein [Mycobacterium kansasii]
MALVGRQEQRIEASSGRGQHKFTVRAKRMAGRGDVPQVPRRPLLGRSKLARIPG